MLKADCRVIKNKQKEKAAITDSLSYYGVASS
jgi:hypothetical protein